MRRVSFAGLSQSSCHYFSWLTLSLRSSKTRRLRRSIHHFLSPPWSSASRWYSHSSPVTTYRGARSSWAYFWITGCPSTFSTTNCLKRTLSWRPKWTRNGRTAQPPSYSLASLAWSWACLPFRAVAAWCRIHGSASRSSSYTKLYWWSVLSSTDPSSTIKPFPSSWETVFQTISSWSWALCTSFTEDKDSPMIYRYFPSISWSGASTCSRELSVFWTASMWPWSN